MKTIRIGNDINVTWKVFSRNGMKYSLEEKELHLWLISGPYKSEITSFVVSFINEVSFNIDQSVLTRYGTYKVVLQIKDPASIADDSTYDLTEVFQIVSQTYPGEALDGAVDLVFESVLNNVYVSTLRGESAYEVAVRNGFTGTEEEWLNSTDGIKGVGIASTETHESEEMSGTSTVKFIYNNGQSYTIHIKNGLGISTVEEIASTESSGVNIWKVTLSDGSVQEFRVKNGRGISNVVKTTSGVGSDADNVFTITYSDGTTSQFTIKNGSQGNSGYSGAASELEVVNNLTDGGATKALSAEQGKVLKGDIDSYAGIKASVFDNQLWAKRDVDLENEVARDYMLLLSGTMGTNDERKHFCVPVEPGEVVNIVGNSENYARFAFLTDMRRLKSNAEYPGEPDRVDAGESWWGVVPADAVALAFNVSTDLGDTTPASVSIYHSKQESSAAANRMTYNPPIIPCPGFRPSDNDTLVAVDGAKAFAVPVKAGYTYNVVFSRNIASQLYLYIGRVDTVPYRGMEVQGYNTSYRATGKWKFTPAEDGFYIFAATHLADLSISDAVGHRVAADGYTPQIFLPTEKADLYQVVDELYNFNPVAVGSLTKRGCTLLQDGCWGSSGNYKHVIVPVTPGDYVKVIKGESSAYIAFLTSNEAPVENAAAPLLSGTHTIYIEDTTPRILRVPEGASYLYVYLGIKPYSNMPSYVGIATNITGLVSASSADEHFTSMREKVSALSSAMGLIPVNIETDSEGWELLPKTRQELNSLKKAQQLCNIKWVPKANIMGKNDPSGTAHEAGVEQTGIPYSGNWHEYKYVGIEVSLHTFMTAVNNRYSLLYTENISQEYTRSAWGKVYYNTNGWSYYGTVCCGFTSSVNGQPTKYGNEATPKVARSFGIFVPIFNDRDLDGLKPSDIYDNNAHSFLIYNLRRDANGHVNGVKIAESTSVVQGTRFRTFGTAQAFLSYINRAGDFFYGYRVADLYKNTDYAPSPYVPLTDFGESPSQVVYNNDICCFAGDKATFMQGNRVAINYNLTDSPTHQWTGIELYRNGSLVQTYLLSEIDNTALDVSQQYHALDLGTTLQPGSYKARMTDGEHTSDYTYFEVLNNNITINLAADGGYVIKVNSNEQLEYVYCGGVVDGGEHFFDEPSGVNVFITRAGSEPSWDERKDNQMVLYFDRLLSDWGYDPSKSESVRIMLRGEYGMAATPPIVLPGR